MVDRYLELEDNDEWDQSDSKLRKQEGNCLTHINMRIAHNSA